MEAAVLTATRRTRQQRATSPPLPPEPLRWLLVRGLMGVLNSVDDRIDRQVRTGRT